MRKFCETLNEPFFKKSTLERATKKTFIENVILFFTKKQVEVDEYENVTTVYKMIGSKMFILNQFFNPPQQYNCRHKTQFTK